MPEIEESEDSDGAHFTRFSCSRCGHRVSDIEFFECAAKWNKLNMTDKDIVIEADRILAAKL